MELPTFINYKEIGQWPKIEQLAMSIMVYCFAIFLGAFVQQFVFDMIMPAAIVFFVALCYLLYKAKEMPWNKNKVAS